MDAGSQTAVGPGGLCALLDWKRSSVKWTLLTTNLTKASVNGKKNPCGDDVFKVRPGPTPRIPGGWAGQAFSLTLNNLKLHFTQQKYWGPRTASLWVSLHVNGSFPKEL